jgi:uncharacterized protein
VTASRLGRLPRRRVLGREVAVAADPRSRLLGLSRLKLEEAGSGLLIPRCRSVHTFGMRFHLDLYFLDAEGCVLEVRSGVRARRFASCRRAAAVLEIPSAPQGGESVSEPT